MASFASKMVDQTALNECQHSITLFCWGRSIKISSDDPEAIAWFAGVYSHFIERKQCIVDISCFILSRSAHRRCPLLLVEGQMYELPETSCYVEHAELILFRYLFEQLDDYIVLHAGVVTRQGRAIIIYGQSGFGKTTLTLELLRRGYGFFSDEFCSALWGRLPKHAKQLLNQRCGEPESNINVFRGKHMYADSDIQI
jgi:hypothetical protein